jgi:aldose sugar dehydrogenase
MDRRTYLTATATALTGLAGCLGSDGESPTTTAVEGVEAVAEPVVTNVEIPWGTTLDDTTLYFTERPGRLRRVPEFASATEAGTESVADLTGTTASVGEGGLLGLAFHPRDSLLYIYQTTRATGRLTNRVLRGDPNASEPTFEPLIEGIPAASTHDGGRLTTEGDALYVTTGDARQRTRAQDRDSLAGKILRYTLEGEAHPENPFDSPVFTYGHRNPQGLAFRGDQLFGAEHGPDHDDEINRLDAGGNYGWPEVMGQSSREAFVDPIATYTPTIAPASATFYDGPIDGWSDTLFFGALAGDFLGRLTFENGSLSERDRLLERTFGRLRSTLTGPEDDLYVTTSNRDGRGSPVDVDDRILRIRPG